MMKTVFESIVLCTLAILTGCAVVDDASIKTSELYSPIERVSEGAMVEHGVITVVGMQPRSDIVVLAPSNQHVVWSRERPYGRVMASEVKEGNGEVEPNGPKDSDRGLWIATGESWNLEDGQGNRLGVLEMCMPKGCIGNQCRSSMTPCVNPEDYLCSAGKMGELCVLRKAK